ncbi:TPA: ABC transporter ATP-binding protein [bacterium]|nr:ABC transporter ATP-binding protein [bacterium]
MFIKRFKNLAAFKPYFKKHIKLIIILISVMLIASSAGVITSYLLSEQLIGITNELVSHTLKFTLIIMVVITIHHINWYLWSKFHYRLSSKVSSDIKNGIVANLLDTKYSYIRENSTGYYLERLNDVDEIATFIGNVAGTFVDVLTNFSFLILIYFLSWQLGLFFTIGVSMLFIIESIKVNTDLRNLEEVKKSSEKTNSHFSEIIHGMKDIKGFGIKEEINLKMKDYNDELLRKTYKKNTQFEFISRIGTYFQWVIDSLLVFISILWLLPAGEISVIVLLIVFNYKGLMYETVGFFSKLKGYYVNGDYYSKRVLEIIKTPYKETFGGNSKNIKEGKISIRDLSFSYGDKRILKEINLEIEPNTLNVLVGSSGSGKSTLFFLLSKLYDIDKGSIYFDNIDINDIDEKTFRKNICIVNQEPFIFNDTILNNILVVRKDANKDDVIKACRLANIHDEIEGMEKGYDTLINENSSNLSGGQKQRIEIARAYLKDCKILLLDEPTSALDSLNQEHLFKTLTKMKSNKTILVIAHKLNDYSYFDNVYDIKKLS